MTGRLTWVSVRAICCPQLQLTGLQPVCVWVRVCAVQWWHYILNTAVTDQSAEFPLYQLLPTTSWPGPPDWDETKWRRAENSFIQADGFRAAVEKNWPTDISMRKTHQTSEQSNYLVDSVHTLGLCVSALNTSVCNRIIKSSWSCGIAFKMKIHLLMVILSYDYRQFTQHATSGILESVTKAWFSVVSSVKFEKGTDLCLNTACNHAQGHPRHELRERERTFIVFTNLPQLVPPTKSHTQYLWPT